MKQELGKRPGGANIAIVLVGFVISLVLASAINAASVTGDGAAPFFFVLFLIAAVPTYFSPAIVAWNYGHPRAMPIAVLNLFLGWTVVGWVVALVWAYVFPTEAQGAAAVASMVDCPYCAEPVKAAAIKCKHCGSALPGTAPP